MENERLIEERKKKVFDFFKNNKILLNYVFLILVIILAIYIRTLPMKVESSTGHPGLWDITTNSWTLGPDLDPFLFLRWAKDIVHSGSIMPYDSF